jgi:hypothetical protein
MTKLEGLRAALEAAETAWAAELKKTKEQTNAN